MSASNTRFQAYAIVFLALSATFFFFWWHTGSRARHLAALPDCRGPAAPDCIVTVSGRIVDRHGGRDQTIVVRFPPAAFGHAVTRSIDLSSDGHGGAWEGHFPVGERIRVRYHSRTPLVVTEPDGHQRQTFDNPEAESNLFRWLGWAFLAAGLYFLWVVRPRTGRGRLLRNAAS